MKTVTIELTNVEYVLIIQRDEDLREDDFEFEGDKALFRKHGGVGYTLMLYGDLPNSGERVQIDLDSCWGFIDSDDVLAIMYENYCSFVQEGHKVSIDYR